MRELDARNQLVAAVRRDLFGPSGPDADLWPGAEPKTLTPGAHFENPRDVVGMFADGSGNEILTSSPLRRYGIGVLYPNDLTRAQEQELDAAQADVALEAEDDEAASTEAPLEPPATSEEEVDSGAGAEPEDADDAGGPPWRPRSMAVSFLCQARATASVRIAITGGRYEPFEATVRGNPGRFWRRRPVTLEAAFSLSKPGGQEEILEAGPLALQVGISLRPHDAGSIVTVYLVNRSSGGGGLAAATEASLFQVDLRAEMPAGVVLPYPQAEVLDGEDRSLDLLYHRLPVRAVGHGCNATVTDTADATHITGSHFPVEVVRSPVPNAVDQDGRPLAIDMDGLGAWSPEARDEVDAAMGAYRRWIDEQRRAAANLPTGLQPTGQRHLDACEKFLSDAEEGWRLATTDTVVRQMLCWTSEAMANQRRAYASGTRPLIIERGKVVGAEGRSPHASRGRSPARWRAFQIMFLLASLPAVVDPSEERREEVDIIWMPTGGGKTEAYSAVAAFVMLWRRYHQVDAGQKLAGQGATILMRYTLRLLTAQQLQRAAALICALEQIRRQHPEQLGKGRKFTIGAWLGAKSTPNSRSSARNALSVWSADPTKRGFLMTRCPWCGATIGRREGAGKQMIDGYKLADVPKKPEKRVMAYCPDPACDFNDENQRRRGDKNPSGLPVYEVDEDLYAQAPTFIVGTIDKFAQLSWRSDPAAFFGLSGGSRTGPGPALLIQDELHLISGPLGSLDALYEPVIEDLCQRDGGELPKVIAATATTRRYREQTAALYGRSGTRLVPPPGLDAADNFFSRVSDDAPGKLFVGICAPGFGKAQEAQVRILAALGHAAGSLDAIGQPADPWWTNLCFFSSRRTLGLVQSLCQTHLRGHSWRLHKATGVHAGPERATGTRMTQRNMVSRIELTAQATSDVSEAMGRLSVPKDERGSADLCFATSMIEVGVDIDRLGLLTMFGQPKSASQYIQVAGRVGRDERNAPGVVFVVLSPYNSRDRSHFEQFSTFHQRLYASVEPVSITPFTPAALERGLAGAIAAWIRQSAYAPTPQAARPSFDQSIGLFERRLPDDGSARRNLDRRAGELKALLDQTTHQEWGILRPNVPSKGFLRPLEEIAPDPADAPDATTTHWLIPTSMRSVDAETGARIVRYLRTEAPAPDPGTPVPPSGTPDADEEDLF
jgi:hypothetical protein